MRVSNGSSTVEVRSFSEKTDLLRHLQARGKFTLLDTQEEREFYSIVIQASFVSTRAAVSWTDGECVGENNL